MINHYCVGSNTISIDAEEYIHDAIKPYMKSTCDYLQSFYYSKIFLVDSKDTFVKIANTFLCHKHECKVFKLKNITYFYDMNNNVYFALNSMFLGKIFLNEQRSVWFLNDKTINGRNLFHTCILDPLSLILPKINKAVFHGSAIKQDNKAILFLGRSGNGKSTITYKLIKSKNTFQKLCDDTFILENSNEILIHPLITGEGYSSDIANKLIEDEKCRLLFQDNSKDKTYIMRENIDYSPISVSHIFFLFRKCNLQISNYTEIYGCNKNNILLNIIDSQTNIASPFLSNKIDLYKKIAQNVRGYKVLYNYECDERLLEKVLLNEKRNTSNCLFK